MLEETGISYIRAPDEPAGWIEATIQFVNADDEDIGSFVADCIELGAVGSRETTLATETEIEKDEACEACGTPLHIQAYFPDSFGIQEIVGSPGKKNPSPERNRTLPGCAGPRPPMQEDRTEGMGDPMEGRLPPGEGFRPFLGHSPMGNPFTAGRRGSDDPRAGPGLWNRQTPDHETLSRVSGRDRAAAGSASTVFPGCRVRVGHPVDCCPTTRSDPGGGPGYRSGRPHSGPPKSGAESAFQGDLARERLHGVLPGRVRFDRSQPRCYNSAEASGTPLDIPDTGRALPSCPACSQKKPPAYWPLSRRRGSILWPRRQTTKRAGPRFS